MRLLSLAVAGLSILACFGEDAKSACPGGDVQTVSGHSHWNGGRTVPANCQMLCKECNRRKGAK